MSDVTNAILAYNDCERAWREHEQKLALLGPQHADLGARLAALESRVTALDDPTR